MIELQPAAQRTISVVTSLADEQLDLATPCPAARVGDLVDHLGVFAVRFLEAARKESGDRTSSPPPPSRANLEPGWRERNPRGRVAFGHAGAAPPRPCGA